MAAHGVHHSALSSLHSRGVGAETGLRGREADSLQHSIRPRPCLFRAPWSVQHRRAARLRSPPLQLVNRSENSSARLAAAAQLRVAAIQSLPPSRPLARSDIKCAADVRQQKSSALGVAGQHENYTEAAAEHGVSREGADAEGAVTGPAGSSPLWRRSVGWSGRGGRRALLAAASAATCTAAFSCPLCPGGGVGSIARADSGNWSYSGLESWGGLCATGPEQSPIDIPLRPGAMRFARGATGPLSFSYAAGAPSFRNTGTGIMQVNMPSGGNNLKVGERGMSLLQFHFHAPSEHTFGGVHSAMEAHLVHKDSDGSLAVVGVMIEGAASAPKNPCLETALQYSPKERGRTSLPLQPPVLVDPTGLLPPSDIDGGGHAYFHYKGTLTTPPCSAGVDWFLLAAPVEVPYEQVMESLRFAGDQATFSLTSRPTQKLGGRRIFIGP